MLYREIIAVCFQTPTKHINKLCGQNVELLNVKPGGIFEVGPCHYGMARLQAADGGEASSYSGQLRIYYKSSLKEPTRVGIPVWDLYDVLQLLFVIDLRNVTFSRTWTDTVERPTNRNLCVDQRIMLK